MIGRVLPQANRSQLGSLPRQVYTRKQNSLPVLKHLGKNSSNKHDSNLLLRRQKAYLDAKAKKLKNNIIYNLCNILVIFIIPTIHQYIWYKSLTNDVHKDLVEFNALIRSRNSKGVESFFRVRNFSEDEIDTFFQINNNDQKESLTWAYQQLTQKLNSIGYNISFHEHPKNPTYYHLEWNYIQSFWETADRLRMALSSHITGSDWLANAYLGFLAFCILNILSSSNQYWRTSSQAKQIRDLIDDVDNIPTADVYADYGDIPDEFNDQIPDLFVVKLKERLMLSDFHSGGSVNGSLYYINHFSTITPQTPLLLADDTSTSRSNLEVEQRLDDTMGIFLTCFIRIVKRIIKDAQDNNFQGTLIFEKVKTQKKVNPMAKLAKLALLFCEKKNTADLKTSLFDPDINIKTLTQLIDGLDQFNKLCTSFLQSIKRKNKGAASSSSKPFTQLIQEKKSSKTKSLQTLKTEARSFDEVLNEFEQHVDYYSYFHYGHQYYFIYLSAKDFESACNDKAKERAVVSALSKGFSKSKDKNGIKSIRVDTLDRNFQKDYPFNFIYEIKSSIALRSLIGEPGVMEITNEGKIIRKIIFKENKKLGHYLHKNF